MKAVAKKNQATEIAFMDDIGSGMEGVDKDSFATPFLRVLQKISPQVDEASAAYVKGAKGGMLLNTVTQRLYTDLIFLPCAFQRRFLRWGPRGSDRGFGGEYLPEDIADLRAKGELVDIDGRLYFGDSDKKSDTLQDTRSHFGLVLEEDGSTSQVLLSLASTQIKKSKQLMSILSSAKIQGQTPPTWMNRIHVTTVLESNDQGSWYGVRFEADGMLKDATAYAAGKAFHAAVVAGEAKADHAKTDEKF